MFSAKYNKSPSRMLTIGFAVLSTLAVNVLAFDTSTIPKKPTSAISLQSGQTYDFGGRTIDGGNIKDSGLFRCMGKDKVTIKNITVTNSPRYALFARGCNNVTISNFKMKNMGSSVGGIRFDQGTKNKNVTLKNISADNVGGHAVELWDTDGFSINSVNAKKTKGCGLLLNRSKNGKVGTVTGDKNDQNGGYATFRVANNNGPNVTVDKVKSRNSGRGFFSVSGARGTTVKSVDISGTNKEGIYIQDSRDTKVNGGKSRAPNNANCRVRGGSGNSVKADCGGQVHG